MTQLERFVAVMATPPALRCACAPGVGEIHHGVAVCSTCGKIMVASTASEILEHMRTADGAHQLVRLADLDELLAAAREAADLLGGRGGGAPLTRVVRAKVCASRLERALQALGPRRGG